MTEFRKDLNKALKEKEAARMVEAYNKGYATLDEVLRVVIEGIEKKRYGGDAE